MSYLCITEEFYGVSYVCEIFSRFVRVSLGEREELEKWDVGGNQTLNM